ncbi:BLUF domain-containing protein [Pseudahrensia aquimaris]|uniref:BLUF domain-containing protein n=1 Tax=Pseudahrensia aquimaris TaxID=744461 RepID=A0ABW3FFM4_9HYPH
MPMKQIIYSSQPFGFDESILSSVLSDARRLNRRDGITGALVCRRDLYLQLLEGPADKVTEAYARIKRDDRHVNVRNVFDATISERMFADWDMLHDPAQSLHWSADQVAKGELDRAKGTDVREVFERIAAQAVADTFT